MATDRSMYEMSPFYAKLVDSYGNSIPVAAASVIAAAHYTTLRLLFQEEGLDVSGPRVSTREFVACLGY